MAQKLRKCKNCKEEFEQFNTLQVRCIKCAIELGKKKTLSDAKKVKTNANKELRKAKEAIKTRSDWMREAQIAYNTWKRESELLKGEGCISCGTHNGKMNCGHYMSVGSNPSLRFDEKNSWLQCERCNSYLSGNLLNYRMALLRRFGQELLNYLEGQHEPKHYSIDDLKHIKAEYKQRLKEIKQ